MMLRRVFAYGWAAPCTLIAGIAAPVALATGGRIGIHSGVIEIWGGVFERLLPRVGPGLGIVAITVGHCVMATNECGLHQTRAHERVHVAQFERWGPLFPFLYAMSSVAAWARGADYYLDNHFEQEARRLTS